MAMHSWSNIWDAFKYFLYTKSPFFRGGHFYFELFLIVSGFASILGLILTVDQLKLIIADVSSQYIWTVIILSFLIVYFFLTKFHPLSFPSKTHNSVIYFMTDFMKRSGPVRIVSRDVSWICANEIIFAALKEKAKDQSVIYYIGVEEIKNPDVLQRIKLLKAAGMGFRKYKNKYEPDCRFTVIGSGTDQTVAFGEPVAKSGTDERWRINVTRLKSSGIGGFAHDILRLLDGNSDPEA